ncbi:MAG: DUF3015 domain-containing protein [Betaproteobacteria bacterium]|nr:DUF3015 domain-containing protein [Betaproteobacteria bacterium]
MKKALLVVACAMAPALAMAAGENNIGSCGWGSKVFDGQSGVVPQVLGATTNGTSGNQTFGITTGTSGCTANGTVRSGWKTAMFIDGNKEQLARDMSKGSGETLDSLATLIGVRAEHRVAFNRVAKDNFARIFAGEASSEQVAAALKDVLAQNAELAQYTATI